MGGVICNFMFALLLSFFYYSVKLVNLDNSVLVLFFLFLETSNGQGLTVLWFRNYSSFGWTHKIKCFCNSDLKATLVYQ